LHGESIANLGKKEQPFAHIYDSFYGMRKCMIPSIMGEINPNTGDEPKIGNTRMSSMIYPNDSRLCHCRAISSGSNPSTTLNPSKGWMGMRLRMARETFTIMTD